MGIGEVMTFYVSSNAQGRVILDSQLHGVLMQTIESSDYELARLLVDESNLYHNEGHGYYRIN